MLEGLQRCFCTRCKLRPIFPTCPGFCFYGPRNTFYAHARYLVMVSRRFYGKKHCFIHVLQQPSQTNTLIINVLETSSHKTLQNTLFSITRGSPRWLFMRTRGTWWWWAVVSIIKSIVPQIAYAWGAPMMFLYPVQTSPIFPTCPGFRFCGPRNTFYAHARYLVMVSRRFYGKKHCFIHVLQQPSQTNTLIINVLETSSHKTLQNTLFSITRGSPRWLFMRTRGTWWWWAVVSIIKSIVPQIAYAWGAPMMFLYPVQKRVHFPDLSRFPFLWSPEHVSCARAVLGDGPPSFLW